MTDILNRCIKCKCSLAAADKTSRLLPCLHTMCDDCVSGRTDVAEKSRRLKEQEEKGKDEQENEKEKEEKNNEEENDKKEQGESSGGDEQSNSESQSEEEPVLTIAETAPRDQVPEEKSREEPRPAAPVETPPEPVRLTECPVCREPFSGDGLIENVFVRKHVAGTEDGTEGDQLCTGCESHPSTSYCLQCDDWLCNDCVDAHKRVRMTKDHQLTSREEVADKGSGVTPNEISMLCRSHPKEKLTLFCDKCEVLTCRDCQLLHHQEHKYHFLQEAADSYKAKLTGSLSLMKERRDTLRHYQTEIEERLSKVKREKGELQQEVLRQADIIVKAVRAAVWSVLSSLHSFTDAAAKRLSREVGDVGDLVGKFDHCISFMEAILEDGLGLPLLFSKTIVETKCRKVYHTQMEPQSLKGQLNIKYRHDVQAVVRSLSNIGAIYVNGTKYPPEKPNTPVASQSAVQNTAPASTVYRGGQGNMVVVGGTAPAPNMPPRVAPQEHSLYMQMMMGRPSHSGPTSQGPTLSLPGSRRIVPSPRSWPGHEGQVGMMNSQPGVMNSMIMAQGQPGHPQQMMSPRASFTPMRLHHRPVEQPHLPSAPPMMLGSQLRPQVTHGVPLGPTLLPAPPPLQNPQTQYRGAADGSHSNSGGQAAIGVRRANTLDSPDPARPASAGQSGLHMPERPLSAQSDGAASSSGIKVKTEPTDNGDCVITSAIFKGGKPSVMATGTLGEMQRNLDEVIRGVPMDLGDNLEPINGSLSPNTSRTATPAMSPPPLVSSSALDSLVSSTMSTTNNAASAGDKTQSSTLAEDAEKEGRGSGDKADEDGFEATGPEVHGYATGNSMPGFTLPAGDSADPNDDYCAACHQGGDVLCCDQCPRVYHLQCHVPVLGSVPNGAFVCTLCEEGMVLEREDEGSVEQLGKRKAPTGLSDRELKVCERILLELFCHASSVPFHEPVNRAVPNYYKIITSPMDFSTIKCKLSRSHFNHYTCPEDFLKDVKLVFKNCGVYNAESSEVGKAGKIVSAFFERLVSKHMPHYCHLSSLDGSGTVHSEPAAKKRRMTPPPPSSIERAGSSEPGNIH